jgi:hypothetical protein
MYNYYNYNDFVIIMHFLESFFELLEYFDDWKFNNNLCRKYNLYITRIIHMYIVIYYHILMGRLHLVHHCKPIHLKIHIIHFEYQEGCYLFGHIHN